MTFYLSVINPAVNGASYGKSRVFPLANMSAVGRRVGKELLDYRPLEVESLTASLMSAPIGAEVTHGASGLTFRIDSGNEAPNVCPCCGRLVKHGDHALAGSDDACCLGCYTWGDADKIGCAPQHSAHPNPWTTDPVAACRSIEITFEPKYGETDYDIRYSADPKAGDLWDEEDNALIAWPGLTREQIINVEIKEIPS